MVVHRVGYHSGRRTPIRVRPGHTKSNEEFSGLIVGGGADVDPALYEVSSSFRRLHSAAESTRKRTGLFEATVAVLVYLLRALFRVRRSGSKLDQERDRLEVGLVKRFMASGQPILGICRGAQLINVVCGGTLQRDLPSYYEEYEPIRTVFPRKRIAIAPESHLAGFVGTDEMRVNALHRQAVQNVGQQLAVVARETSGVPQAIEHDMRAFVIGVQWHPELLPQSRRQQLLFQALVAACRNGERGRP